MWNTYGLRSINNMTFNQNHGDLFLPKHKRNLIVTFLRVHNLTLNILGYIPSISVLAGSVRIFTGISMVFATLCAGPSLISRPWYHEALKMGAAQIIRGIFEAVIPFGWIVNATLDVTATNFNFNKTEFCDNFFDDDDCVPHRDVNYAFPFKILYLV